MLRRVLHVGVSTLLRVPPATPGAPGAAYAALLAVRELRRAGFPARYCAVATAEDALSSGKAPSTTPPDNPVESSQDFDRLADLYLGGLWERKEAGLAGTKEEQESGRRFDAQFEHDGLRVCLPDGGKIVIAKDPSRRSLVVRTNLHDFYGSDGADNEVPFRLQADKTWETDGEELHSFLEDGLAKHLKVQVDLEPEAQTLYGPDPT